MALGTKQLPFQNQQHHQILAAQQRLYQQRAIAPAPTSSSNNVSRLYMPYTKPPGYINTAGTTLDSNNPSVVRRNARERNRVKQVNNGFVNLRQHIPQAIVADLSNGRRGGTGPSASKKLSKVDTLRMAVEYIRRLKRVIDEVDQSDTDSSSMSSYNSCSSGSLSGSPPPLIISSSPSLENVDAAYKQQQQTYFALSYAGSFHPQHQQMTSPAGSTSSSTYSDPCSSNSTNSASYYNSHNHLLLPQSTPLKFEPPTYEEYPNTSTEDEELLDYISLWQEDM